MPTEYEPTPYELKLQKLAEPYSYEMDLAFFVVQVGMTKNEFDTLSEKEKLFIRKAHENKFVSDTTWMRNAFLNAEANINRKKNKKFIELFPKNQKADIEYNENAIQTITEMEEEKGKSWVDKIFKANGMKKPNSDRKE